MTTTRPFDPAEYLDTPEALAAYRTDALETGDPAFVADALGIVARARGISESAREAGVSRESLYRSLSTDGNPPGLDKTPPQNSPFPQPLCLSTHKVHP